MGKVIAAGFLLLFLASCQTTNADSCAGFKPIRPTVEDTAVISQHLVDQLVVHNETGASLCKWQP